MSKKFLALAAIALVAGLTACSPAEKPAPPAPVETEAAPPVEQEDDTTASTGTLGVKESCELFNDRWAELAEIPDGDGKAYLDYWLALEEVIPTVAEDTYGLFTTLRLFSIERNSDEGPSDETKALMTQWFLGTSGACTQAGVTLEL